MIIPSPRVPVSVVVAFVFWSSGSRAYGEARCPTNELTSVATNGIGMAWDVNPYGRETGSTERERIAADAPQRDLDARRRSVRARGLPETFGATLLSASGQIHVSWFGDFLSRVSVERAVEGAVRRLARPSCALILADFKDRFGRNLSMRLDAEHISVKEHTANLWFIDGSESQQCRNPILAFTTTGGATIEICASAFKRYFARDRRLAELVMIHEILHTLGLGENPPTSHAITVQVVARCG